MKLVTLYIAFAVIATLFNLLAQEVMSLLYKGQHSFWLSLLLGTLVGLVIKYSLDKRYIFSYYTYNQQQNLQTFILYAMMGVVTTCIFWLSEYAFDYWFAQDKLMRYVGGMLGLPIGFITKYYLDKRYVFV